jgi:Cobalamin-independent synthase, Catalytic domain
MPAADEHEALRRAGMAREDSSCRLRMRYRTADVRGGFVLAQAFVDESRSRSCWRTSCRASTTRSIDVASERVETAEDVAATIEQASRFVSVEQLYPCTNCGMAPMDRSLAIRKLAALSAGAALVRGRSGS